MNNYDTQNDYIYGLLIERGSKGINSFERVNGGVYAPQLPRCISNLEDRDMRWKLTGKIEHRKEKDTSVTYILHDVPNFVQPEKKNVAAQFYVKEGRFYARI